MKPAPSGIGSDAGIYCIAGGVVVGALLWAAGALSALIAGNRVPRGPPLAGVEALAHPGNPAWAWGAPVGPPVFYWASTAIVVLLVAGAVIAAQMTLKRVGLRGKVDPSRIEGLATRRQIEAAAGAKTLVSRAAILLPSLPDPKSESGVPRPSVVPSSSPEPQTS